MGTGNTVRIVVTGTGIFSPLGCGSDVVWSRLLAGQSGIRTLPAEFTEGTAEAPSHGGKKTGIAYCYHSVLLSTDYFINSIR